MDSRSTPHRSAQGHGSYSSCAHSRVSRGLATHLPARACRPRVPQSPREIFEVIRGRSPFEIERLRNAALFKVAAAEPRQKRITAAACSALEQCMWDLQGKTLGVPCYPTLRRKAPRHDPKLRQYQPRYAGRESHSRGIRCECRQGRCGRLRRVQAGPRSTTWLATRAIRLYMRREFAGAWHS